MGDPTSDPEFRFASSIAGVVDERIRSASVPIFAANLEAVQQVGSILVANQQPIAGVASGTLFSAGDSHFLITAAHVIQSFTADGLQLRVAMGDRPQPIPIVVANTATDDENDVAAVLLSADLAGQFRGKRFLGPDDLAPAACIADWRCLLFGYLWDGTQSTRDRTGLLLRNYEYWTRQYTGPIATQSYDPARHTLVELYRNTWSISHGAESANPASLGGLSGSALWRVFRPDHTERGWTPAQMKVVAIENVVYDDRIIGCTNIELVIPLLTSLVPGIAHSFR